MSVAIPGPAWLVGCGNMAGAMVDGWRSAGVDFSDVTVIRPSGTPVEGVRTITSLPEEQRPRFVMLGVKPQKLDELVPDLAPHIGRETMLVSILAGVSVASLRDRFPAARAIVRLMPNLPVSEGVGVVAVFADAAGSRLETEIGKLLQPLGMVAWCKSERELGVIGAVAAAGVAYVARFAEALGKSAGKLGLSKELATSVALKTLAGTAAYAAANHVSMREIARRVASPGGTTERGLEVLDEVDGLQQLVDRTLEAAVLRGDELAAEAARRN